METDWDEDYHEGEEHFYDEDGAFGVGIPPESDSASRVWSRWR